ncbi:ankyrin repeat domain-containing protein [bacterium]|nr:ankyrin repeat domain-containing protein [bacterium]
MDAGSAPRRPALPLARVLVLVVAAWSAALVPWQRWGTRPTAEESDRVESSGARGVLEQFAEMRGDRRSQAQIERGNALVEAASAGDEPGARAALRRGAAVDARYVDPPCRYGETALMAASAGGHDGVVRLLLDRGADVNLEQDGYTALHRAVEHDREAVVRVLAAAGARHDPERLRLTHLLVRAACKGFAMRDGDGFPPHPGAVDGSDSAPSIADVLGQGADVNAADPRGFTPLMYAANLGLVENVRALVAGGADVAARARDGSTALSLAARPDSSFDRDGRRAVVEFLQERLPSR